MTPEFKNVQYLEWKIHIFHSDEKWPIYFDPLPIFLRFSVYFCQRNAAVILVKNEYILKRNSRMHARKNEIYKRKLWQGSKKSYTRGDGK